MHWWYWMLKDVSRFELILASRIVIEFELHQRNGAETVKEEGNYLL
jgi:hypothetical protein